LKRKEATDLGLTHEKGTKIHFHPDPSIWSTINLDVETLIDSFSQLVDEYPGIEIFIQNRQLGGISNF
jgi:DNA gyrase/topoisomerase IV subunit B